MSDQSRPASRWSTSMSIATKSTAATSHSIPLITVRRKLLRQSTKTQKAVSDYVAKSKTDIEELFKLYYSNDIKFDTFERQIVTGKRIPTARASQQLQPANPTNAFDSKHCVSREQIDSDYNVQQPIGNATKEPLQTPNDNPLPQTAIPAVQNPPETSSFDQQDDLCGSLLVKSLVCLDDTFDESGESLTIKKSTHRPVSSKSSLSTIAPGAPPPSLLAMNNTNLSRKDPTVSSHTSFSTITSLQQQNRPTIVTGSAVIVRQRSPTKQTPSKQRTKSTTNSSTPQATAKNCSPSIYSPLTIHPDMPELPVFLGTPRVVSIPSKCSRYVLVSFPEVPLRYNAPTYVERLLLPERFPTLFQNIIHSYDSHLTHVQHNRNAK